MARICVNQYEDYVGSDGVASFADLSTPRCIANWAHTQEQVFIAIGLWVFILLVATGWTFASRRQRRQLRMDELGFSLKLRRWARTSRTAALLNRPVQLITSLGIFLFMVSRCNSYEVSAVGYYCMSVLYVVALADASVRFLAARYKVLYCFAPLTMLECFMLASHCQVGFGSIKIINGVPTRSWLDSSIMRPIFILRSYLEMERHLPRSSRGWMMGRLGIKVMLLIIFGASAMFFLETLGEMPFFTQNGFAHLYTCASDGSVTRDASSCEESGETWSIMFSFYFTVVTLGTVGYGDNAPKTVLSRLLAIMFIVMGVILFSLEIENLINLYKSRQIGNPPFKPKQRDARHVVVMGNPSFAQLSSILRELFHEDHTSSTSGISGSTGVGAGNNDDSAGGGTAGGARGGGRLHAVVLGDRKSKFTKGLVAKLEADPLFAANVTYVAGNPTRVEDLERARAREAEAVFVFPDKLSDDPASEDALNIMRVLATRRYCGPYVRCLVMVLRADSARHMLAAGVSRDDVICENVIKMGTLAQSTVSHGASTMLANLAASLSIDRSVEEEGGGASPSTTMAAATKSSRDLRPSSWVLKDLAASSKSRHWLKEYYHGAAKEMYMIKLSKKYAGLTFAETASRIFNETEGNVVLIAVEVVFSGNEDAATISSRSSESRVLLNPGCSLIMAEWMQCYVIADDLAYVFTHQICPDEITQDEMIRVGAGAGSPLVNTLADTFIEPANGVGDATMDGAENEVRNGDSFQNVTAYTSMATPHHSQQHQQRHGKGFDSTAATIESIARLREQRQDARVGHGTENVILDRSLRAVALNICDAVDGPYGGDTLGSSYASNVDTSIHVTPNYHHFSAARRISSSSAGGSSGDLSIRSLEPPPLSVLLNPRHIVVCSFLGEESLVSLQWLLLPLRGVYADSGHPPITILDAAELSPAVAASLSAFDDVYYVQGSPLVYADLQRAGAKAAASVVVLGKRTKAGLMKSAGDETVETSIIDAEAIFCTMLIELKMDFTKIFTITELSDESNSKFLGTSFQLRHLVPGQETAALANHALDDETDSSLSWWEYLLLNDIPQQKSEKAIIGLPLYMSGRLLHPELCENMLVQTFYNPSIHKIIRQLVGGPRCTGVIRSYAVPRQFQHGATYGDVFCAFAASSYAGICMGVYRLSTQTLRYGNHVELPIVLSTPEPHFRIVGSDRLFVLVGVHTLARAALCIQRFYRKFTQDDAALPPPPAASSSSSGDQRATRAASFLNPRGRISKYLATQQASGFEMLSVPKSQRRSLIAQESNSSFRSYYV